jgi:hypothetical protein
VKQAQQPSVKPVCSCKRRKIHCIGASTWRPCTEPCTRLASDLHVCLSATSTPTVYVQLYGMRSMRYRGTHWKARKSTSTVPPDSAVPQPHALHFSSGSGTIPWMKLTHTSPQLGPVARNGRQSVVQRTTSCQGGPGTHLMRCRLMRTAPYRRRTGICCSTMFLGAGSHAHEML